MPKSKVTSPKAASSAGKVLASPKSSKNDKAAAGSALSQKLPAKKR